MASQPQYVICVCTANICRSPMAEALLRHALAAEPEPLKSLRVTSAGVNGWPGQRISYHSDMALKKVGLDHSKHLSRDLRPEMLARAVLVLCMTESHRRAIKMDFPDLKAPVLLMRELLPPPANPEVPDPYGADMQTYEDTRDAIVEAIPSVVQFLREKLGASG
ncbi:MAG: low molecular weight protein arginine phosphatase [Opitutales bacterium]|nr:low molecular weight protein arginine phosphatase [Opitutales bacterium]